MKQPVPANPVTAPFARPMAERLLKGQYTTPPTVCDLMLALLLRPDTQSLLDAGCGTGAFVLRAAAFAKARQQPLSLQALDLDADALQTARALLGKMHAHQGMQGHHTNFIGPLPIADESLDALISNPPYVRQEHVSQGRDFDKAEGLNWLKVQYADYLVAHPGQEKLFSRQADLYAWFLLRAQLLLKPGGRLAMITSNSWLSTAFGESLQHFLQHHFEMECLLESACERWFSDAAVNPVILIARKKTVADREPDTSPRLIRLMLPLADWLPDSRQDDYWGILHTQCTALLTPEKKIVTSKPAEGSAVSGWTQGLRNPAELMHVLEAPAHWGSLGEYGAVRYPLKTGINRFFYRSEKEMDALGIEPEFRLPVLKSGREVQRYVIAQTDCPTRLFHCDLSKEHLKAAGKTGALAYVEWGETQSAPPRQKRALSVLWPEVPSVKSHRPWHHVPALPPAAILCNRFFDQRFFFALNPDGVLEDQTFYGFLPHAAHAENTQFIAALLNSTLSYLQIELRGRRNLGEGVLQFARRDMAAFPLLRPELFSAAQRASVLESFEAMMQREILPLEQELQQADRQALDQIILQAFDVADQQSAIAKILQTRVSERRALARSLK